MSVPRQDLSVHRAYIVIFLFVTLFEVRVNWSICWYLLNYYLPVTIGKKPTINGEAETNCYIMQTFSFIDTLATQSFLMLKKYYI
jgi:hypothetical protein